jgi:predicted transcriptional regulator
MKRGREEIIARLLSLCSEGTTRTRLVYNANLNFKTIKPYLELLVKNGRVEIKTEGQNDKYETTDKGEELLGCFKKIQAHLNTKEDKNNR